MDGTGVARRNRFGEDCRGWIEGRAGLPLVEGEIKWDFEGRGNQTRQFCNRITNFAMQAFWLEEQVDIANEALVRLCRHYLDHPHDLHESHSFHWSGAIFGRLWSFFGPEGTIHANRMSADAQSLLLKVMWSWASVVSPILNPDTRRIWRIPNTENHHVMGAVTAWSFSEYLSHQDAYGSRPYTDGRSAADHHLMWTEYFKAYFRARAGKGQCVEIACNVYNGPTLHGWYNVFDFANDTELKRLAGCFLDLYWASWAEDQIDRVRGGGKTRIYPNKARIAEQGGLAKMAELYFGERSDGSFSIGEWVVATSEYRPSEVVYAIAFDTEGRGEYEVAQRCMGLQEPGWARMPDPPVLPFGISSLREDLGGILRYSYCTPDFVAGTLMLDARPVEAWSGSALQNRWHGVIFRGHPDARIVPTCTVSDPVTNPRGDAYNAQWSVQKMGAMMVQTLGSSLSRDVGDSRVWVSEAGLSKPVEENGWVFVEGDGAFAGIRVFDGGYVLECSEDVTRGTWIRCLAPLSPVVIEVGRRSEHHSFDAFRQRVSAQRINRKDDQVSYESIAGHALKLHTDYSQLPEVDGIPVDLGPARVYDSPFIQSDWDSGVVRLRFEDREEVLDFNRR